MWMFYDVLEEYSRNGSWTGWMIRPLGKTAQPTGHVILQGNPLAKQDSTNNQQIGFMESLKEPHFWHQIKSLFCIRICPKANSYWSYCWFWPINQAHQLGTTPNREHTYCVCVQLACLIVSQLPTTCPNLQDHRSSPFGGDELPPKSSDSPMAGGFDGNIIDKPSKPCLKPTRARSFIVMQPVLGFKSRDPF